MATGFINWQYSQGIPKDKVLLPLILAIYYRIDFKHGGLQTLCGKDQLFSTVFSCQYYLVLIPRFALIFFFFFVNNWGGDTRDTYITSSPRANEKYFYLAQQKSSACLVCLKGRLQKSHYKITQILHGERRHHSFTSLLFGFDAIT